MRERDLFVPARDSEWDSPASRYQQCIDDNTTLQSRISFGQSPFLSFSEDFGKTGRIHTYAN